ncbi:putative Proteasome subunit beta type-6 [Blattamonas nauphoetae]|uniref:Proteasome subunit beta n=1 Tax=Blattamonas nauphoetae TaxID=2049346 RepID=A0ABQ9XG70_9EUKA|nr:putative Proteasome subunit beta type-6 [Blattamonas nauphoetae]
MQSDLNLPVDLGTTIMALKFDGGLLLAADSRTSQGSYVSNRMADKITPLIDDIYVCRSGSSADTQTVAGYARYSLDFHSQQLGKRPSVQTAAYILRDFAYQNKEVLSVSFICAGLDDEKARIFSIAQGGAIFEQKNYAAAGSGSTYVLTYLDEKYRPNMTETEVRELAVRAVSLAMFRDNSSGGCIRLCVLKPNTKPERIFLQGDQVQSMFPVHR